MLNFSLQGLISKNEEYTKHRFDNNTSSIILIYMQAYTYPRIIKLHNLDPNMYIFSFDLSHES
jgi:hypothetical protein